MTVAMGFSSAQENLARPNLQTLVRCPHWIVIPAKAGIQTPPQTSYLSGQAFSSWVIHRLSTVEEKRSPGREDFGDG